MKKSVALFLFSVLLLGGCGKPDSAAPQPPVDKSQVGKMRLLLFGAPWCSSCKDELTLLDPQLRTIPRTKLKTVLYVISGDNPSIHPTPAIARAYGAKYHLHFTARPDPWEYTNYRKYFQGGSASLPAAVLLDDKTGTVLHKFMPSTYVPQMVISEIRTRLK